MGVDKPLPPLPHNEAVIRAYRMQFVSPSNMDGPYPVMRAVSLPQQAYNSRGQIPSATIAQPSWASHNTSSTAVRPGELSSINRTEHRESNSRSVSENQAASNRGRTHPLARPHVSGDRVQPSRVMVPQQHAENNAPPTSFSKHPISRSTNERFRAGSESLEEAQQRIRPSQNFNQHSLPRPPLRFESRAGNDRREGGSVDQMNIPHPMDPSRDPRMYDGVPQTSVGHCHSSGPEKTRGYSMDAINASRPAPQSKNPEKYHPLLPSRYENQSADERKQGSLVTFSRKPHHPKELHSDPRNPINAQPIGEKMPGAHSQSSSYTDDESKTASFSSIGGGENALLSTSSLQANIRAASRSRPSLSGNSITPTSDSRQNPNTARVETKHPKYPSSSIFAPPRSRASPTPSDAPSDVDPLEYEYSGESYSEGELERDHPRPGNLSPSNANYYLPSEPSMDARTAFEQYRPRELPAGNRMQGRQNSRVQCNNVAISYGNSENHVPQRGQVVEGDRSSYLDSANEVSLRSNLSQDSLLSNDQSSLQQRSKGELRVRNPDPEVEDKSSPEPAAQHPHRRFQVVDSSLGSGAGEGSRSTQSSSSYIPSWAVQEQTMNKMSDVCETSESSQPSEINSSTAALPILGRKLTDFLFNFAPETLGLRPARIEGYDDVASEGTAKSDEDNEFEVCDKSSEIEEVIDFWMSTPERDKKLRSTSAPLQLHTRTHSSSSVTKEPESYYQFEITPQPFLRPNGKQGYKVTGAFESFANKSPSKVPLPLVIRKKAQAPTVATEKSVIMAAENNDTASYLTSTMRIAHTPNEHNAERISSAASRDKPLPPRPDGSPSSIGRWEDSGRAAPHLKTYDLQRACPKSPTSISEGTAALSPSPAENRSVKEGVVERTVGGLSAEDSLESLGPSFAWVLDTPALTTTQEKLERQVRATAAREMAEEEALAVAAARNYNRAIAAATKPGQKHRLVDIKKSPGKRFMSDTHEKAQDMSSCSGEDAQLTTLTAQAPDIDERCPIMGTHPIRGISHNQRASRLQSPPGRHNIGSPDVQLPRDGAESSDEEEEASSGNGERSFGHYAVRNRKSYNMAPISPNVNSPVQGSPVHSPRRGNENNASRANAAQVLQKSNAGCFQATPLYPEGADLTPDQLARQYEYLERERIRQDTFQKNRNIFGNVKEVEEQRKAAMARQKGMAQCSVCGRWREPGTKCCDVRVRSD